MRGLPPQPADQGRPAPLFTDTEYEALGVPRNPRLAANRDPHFFDMGLCGPLRTDLARQTQYCGMFLTPTLRNAAKRGVYFHNGVYHSLEQVMNFYNLRDTHPEKIYPRDASGRVVGFNDLPTHLHANIDTADAPFDRKAGDKPALTDSEIADIIAFIERRSMMATKAEAAGSLNRRGIIPCARRTAQGDHFVVSSPIPYQRLTRPNPEE